MINDKGATLAEKVEYVRARLGTAHRGHTCHWPGCTTQCSPAAWGCRPHWFSLPPVLRRKIWAAYKPGQEAKQNPSDEYVAVAREVQDWIAAAKATAAARWPQP